MMLRSLLLLQAAAMGWAFLAGPAHRSAARRHVALGAEGSASKNVERSSIKDSILEAFVPAGREGAPSAAEGLLVDPTDLSPLKEELRVFGPRVKRALVASRRYQAVPCGSSYAYDDLVAEEGSGNVTLVDVVGDAMRSVLPTSGNRLRSVGQEMFRSPYIAWLYERGWRQNFRNAGFRPEDVEFREIEGFFSPMAVAANKSELAGAPILDLSCGSGLWTRRLAASGMFSSVFAGDYSEAMLRETAARLERGGLASTAAGAPRLVRLDAARLPFATASLGAVHAGAALHCWPQREEGLSEVHRTLKAGGRFYATTFLRTAYGLPQGAPRQTSGFYFFELQELEDLMVQAGFLRENVEVRREGGGCAIVKCVKGDEETDFDRVKLPDQADEWFSGGIPV